jgi:hypothetical protein
MPLGLERGSSGRPTAALTPEDESGPFRAVFVLARTGDLRRVGCALLGLGCQPNPPGHTTGHPCTVEPDGSSVITVNGNVTATDADTVLLNGITVNKNVTETGGGEDVIPWTIKNNTIGGNLTVSGVTPNWLGVLLNKIGGNATLTNITITDPGDPSPTMFVVSNTVGRNLICMGLGPNLVAGFPGEFNVVGHPGDRSVQPDGRMTAAGPHPSATTAAS